MRYELIINGSVDINEPFKNRSECDKAFNMYVELAKESKGFFILKIKDLVTGERVFSVEIDNTKCKNCAGRYSTSLCLEFDCQKY